mmetsp:Transcript_24312/g.67597  ORF Transcript_24312/g.67597 Transcript_24312/m.67597 type:complete len:241 (+) Transcript_24312:1214-1936(+)
MSMLLSLPVSESSESSLSRSMASRSTSSGAEAGSIVCAAPLPRTLLREKRSPASSYGSSTAPPPTAALSRAFLFILRRRFFRRFWCRSIRSLMASISARMLCSGSAASPSASPFSMPPSSSSFSSSGPFRLPISARRSFLTVSRHLSSCLYSFRPKTCRSSTSACTSWPVAAWLATKDALQAPSSAPPASSLSPLPSPTGSACLPVRCSRWYWPSISTGLSLMRKSTAEVSLRRLDTPSS